MENTRMRPVEKQAAFVFYSFFKLILYPRHSLRRKLNFDNSKKVFFKIITNYAVENMSYVSSEDDLIYQ